MEMKKWRIDTFVNKSTRQANYFDSLLEAIEFGTKQGEKTFLLKSNPAIGKYDVVSKLWTSDKICTLNKVEVADATFYDSTYVCPTCGGVISIERENFDSNEDEYAICEHCNTIISSNMIDELEEYPFYQWLCDEVLDIEYILDSRKNLIGVTLYLTINGPTIWLDTRRGEYRSSEGWVEYVPNKLCDAINDYIAELEVF